MSKSKMVISHLNSSNALMTISEKEQKLIVGGSGKNAKISMNRVVNISLEAT